MTPMAPAGTAPIANHADRASRQPVFNK
jgi:hypothetical protein